MFKKVITLTLIVSFFLSIVPIYAVENNFISEELQKAFEQMESESNAGLNQLSKKTQDELRQAIIGDEKWIENFPNGLFNFVGTQFEIRENQEFLEIPVVRQGGTLGKVSVDFKVIDISAEYGKDYVIRVYENSDKNTIDKNEASSPLIEAVGDNATINISEPGDESAEQPEARQTSDEHPPVEQHPAEQLEVSGQVSAEEALTTPVTTGPASVYLPGSTVTVGEGSGKTPGSLREARNIYFGEESDRPDWKTVDKDKVEDLKAQYDKFLYNVPGSETTLVFNEGEYIKYLYLIPLNDQLSESEEQVLFALGQPKNGASRGEFYMAYANIVDDEAPEASTFFIEEGTASVKDGRASVVVKRTGGLHHNASVIIGTKEGTALSGIDYGPGMEELFFTPGTAAQTVYVNILENPARSKERQFTIALDRNNAQVNNGAGAVTVTIPVTDAINADVTSKRHPANNNGSVLMATSSEPININAEKLSPYGHSPEKAKWILTGEDFLKAGYSSDNAILPQVAGNGLFYDYTNNYSDQKLGYDIGSLGGIDSISFNYMNHGSGDQNGRYDYSLIFGYGHKKFISEKSNSKQIQGYKDLSGYEMQVFKNNPYVASYNSIFLASRSLYYCKTRPVISDITLHLKEYQAIIQPAKIMQRQAYGIENGKMHYQEVYKDFVPGVLHIERVDSNVGNHKKSDIDKNVLIDNTAVYRSDRIKFVYDYTEDNPFGKYAEFVGFELIKDQDDYQPVFFEGTELVLDANFFKTTGASSAVNQGQLKIRPVFRRTKAELEIEIDTQYGYLKNLANLQKSDRTYNKQTDPAAPQIFVGDVIKGLELFPDSVASKRPSWATVAGPNAESATGRSYFTLVDKSDDTVADYSVDDIYNRLILGFKVSLVIKADPNIYKDSITLPVYWLDGVAFKDWSEFTSAVEKAYDDEGNTDVNKNPTVEMEFSYVFDNSVPRPTDLGKPQQAILKVYDRYGSERKSYPIDPVAIGSNTFRFSCRPREEGWQLDDFATIKVLGDLIINRRQSSTQELAIDFLANSRDVITVRTPEGDEQPLLLGDIKTPIVIEDANPLDYYTMQAINSPGFEVSWQDGSPDLDNDAQIDNIESDYAFKRLKKLYPDIKILDEVYNGNLFWNYYQYVPKYFDPSTIYYSFETLPSGTTRWDVGIKLQEQYNTVLNPNFTSRIDPIIDAEVYFGSKRITTTNGPGIYVDSDSIYGKGKFYPGHVILGKQVYDIVLVGARKDLICTINTSSQMMPKDFHAIITKGSSSEDQNLGINKTNLNIEDADTTFSYRIDSTKAGYRANDSVIRIYDTDHNLFLERRTGAPSAGMFSLNLNTAKEGIGPDFSMTIAGIYEQKDEKDNVIMTKEYPEVRVGLKFSRVISAMSILAGFQPDVQPVLDVVGKLNNKYDLGMDLVIDDNDDTTLEKYTDKAGRQRYYKFITFGYDGTYTKELKEKSKDTEKNGDKIIIDSYKDDTEDIDDEGKLNSKVKDATTKEGEPNQPVTKSSGGGDFSMEYKISLALAWEKKYDPDDGSLYSSHYFNSLVLMATATFPGFKKERTYITPIGVPVTVSLRADGSATAILAFEADRDDDPYDEKYKLEDSNGNISLKPQNYNSYARFMIYPAIHLSATAGDDDMSITLGGTAKFDLIFNVPIMGDNIKSSGTGGVTISAYLKIKFLFVQKQWTLYSHDRIEFFSYGSALDKSLKSVLNNPYQNYLYEKLGPVEESEVMNRDYLSSREAWDSSDAELLQGANGIEKVLQKGVFPDPRTKLLPIDENRTLLLFIEDDLTRDNRNRASLKYSILSDGGGTMPVSLDSDGTWDESPDAFKIGNRILVTWSDADRAYTRTDTEKNILMTMNISGKWLDLNTMTFGDEFAITRSIAGSDRYADMDPKITYDPDSKRLMVFYNKTDYNDRWTYSENISDSSDLLLRETPEALYGDIVNGYNLIAYRYADYDNDKDEFIWNETYLPEEKLDAESFYGQRFLNLAPPASITETEHQITDETIIVGSGSTAVEAAITHTGTIQEVVKYNGTNDPRIIGSDLTTCNGYAVFAYIMDPDSDLQTYEDQQLYIQTYNYASNTFSLPIGITNNTTQDTHPRFVQNGSETYLFWLQDGNVVFTCISELLGASGRLKEVVSPDSGRHFYIIDKSNSSKEAHIKSAVNHSNRIEEFKISAKDDMLYIFWTESDIANNADNPALQYKERQVYAACAAAENDHFKWSGPVKVTKEDGANYSDLSFVVTAEDSFTFTAAKYGSSFDENAGYFTDEHSVKDMVVNYITIDSVLELGEITTDSEYPMGGETIAASAILSNDGLDTFANPCYQYYTDINGNRFYESEWTEFQYDGTFELLGGSDAIVDGHFSMPDTMDGVNEIRIGFRVKDDSGKIITGSEKLLFVKPNLKISIMDSRLTGANKARLYIYISNAGNRDFDDSFTVSAGTKVLYDGKAAIAAGESLQMYLDINLGDTPFSGLLAAEDGNRFDMLTLTCKFGEFEASTDLVRKVTAEAFNELDKVEKLSVNINGRLLREGERIELLPGETASAEMVISKKEDIALPEEASSNPLKIVWQSSNNKVVHISQDGSIVPISHGRATVTAILKPHSMMAETNENGSCKIEDAPYMLPESVNRRVSFVVNVVSKLSSTGGESGGESPAVKPVASVTPIENADGDRLVLSVNDGLFSEASKSTVNTLVVNSSKCTEQTRRVALDLTAGNLQSMSQSTISRLIINSSLGSVTLDRNALDAIIKASSGKEVSIEFAKNEALIEVWVKAGGDVLTNLGKGAVILAMPHNAGVEDETGSIVVYEQDENGTRNIVKASLYRLQTGEIVFRTGKLGKFTVGHNTVAFTDSVGWAKEYIDLLSSRGIINGIAKDKFGQDKVLTRAEFIAMLARLSGYMGQSGMAVKFTDVDPNAWYAKYVGWAYENGIANGTGETTFSPNKPISREEMALILINYLRYMQVSLEQEETGEFEDIDTVSKWALDAVKALKAANIVSGNGNNKFEPKRLSTRAEATKVVAEVIKLLLE